ncbi:MAG: Phosphopantetheine adenylyltransferase [Elusimicrobia bacterium ADurb.Bin231]|nr:MAG: Phosphopantetheine adenylyltransferase [Elusimicrobia bacterium ADurb.Bin231]
MKRIAVYPGSFDPVTRGHLDIIKRSSEIFDELIVAVISNPAKKSFFSIEQRLQLLKDTLNFKNVAVKSFEGLLVNFMEKEHAKIIVRGLRAVSDFEYEFQMALTNRKINPEIETVFLASDEKWTYLSSTLVKEIALYGGRIECFVTDNVEHAIRNKVESVNKSKE